VIARRYRAPAVRQEGPAFWLMLEHWRRMHMADCRAVAPSDWPWWDTEDYCLDAPDEMPAGSCVEYGPWFGPTQSTFTRGEA
jgi:hypothetical protein